MTMRVTADDADLQRRRRVKNVAVALLLVAFVVLFYFVTIIKIDGALS